MVLNCEEMRALEAGTFAAGVTADELMEEAGLQIARAVRQFAPQPGVCLAVFGKGNNGGDALVAARHLAAWGWEVRLVPAFPATEWGPLPREKFAAAADCTHAEPASLAAAKGSPLVVLDGLLGIGAMDTLREPLRTVTVAINELRRRSNALVFAIDVPTGLNGDTGKADASCIVADFTLTIGFAKPGLIADAATNYTGRLCVLPLGEFSARRDAMGGSVVVNSPQTLSGLLPRRGFDSHKGDFGRVGVIAGSPGFLGAAALCAGAAVRAGAGLVTLYATPDYYDSLARLAPPEVMVRRVSALDDALVDRHDAVALGPGLGVDRARSIERLVRELTAPAVIDADALNCIAPRPHVLDAAPAGRVLTPHPGEMERLAPGSAARPRFEAIREFTAEHSACTLLLKGARTCIAKSGGPISVNTTGNPGLAKGGSGDTLTGVIAALIAQHIRPPDAARLGAWLCGRAAEIAISHGGETEETLTATRALGFIPNAIRDLRNGCF